VQSVAALKLAHAAFLGWRESSPAFRSRHLRNVARILRVQCGDLAGLITAEVGKPITQSRAEIEKCAMVCEFYARHGADFLADEHPAGAPRQARVAYEPLGPVLAVMPWNFPCWQVFRAAAPALMAGNPLVLKHASNVSGCAVAIAQVFTDAKLPRGLFQTLLVRSAEVPALIADPRIRRRAQTVRLRAWRQRSLPDPQGRRPKACR
jgi:succinate-semialdehyde dehydrogenase/glutarate-semialdehyde dehydrogenase